jgi:maltose O-acetyltransferase
MNKMTRLLLKIINKIRYMMFDFHGYFWKLQFETCGLGVKFWGLCNIKNPENIKVGNNVTFNDGAYLNGLGKISLGDNVSISAMSIIVSTGLDADSLPTSKIHIDKAIVIGDNVQVGVGAIILAGVSVGDNVVIGAGAIVTRDIHSNCIVAGNPARVIRCI